MASATTTPATTKAGSTTAACSSRSTPARPASTLRRRRSCSIATAATARPGRERTRQSSRPKRQNRLYQDLEARRSREGGGLSNRTVLADSLVAKRLVLVV